MPASTGMRSANAAPRSPSRWRAVSRCSGTRTRSSGSRERARSAPMAGSRWARRPTRPVPSSSPRGRWQCRSPESSSEAGKDSVKLSYGDKQAEVDYLCIAGGRAPDTEALNLDEAGVNTGDGGLIEIDEYQRTSNQRIYAIGDLVRGPALAHKASEEGV